MQFATMTDLAEGQALETDICIVGSGPAGLTLARELAHGRKKVLVVESGGESETAFTDSLNELESVGARRVMDQRVLRNRLFGGSAKTWTGRCAAFAEIDFETRPWAPFAAWPFPGEALAPYLERAREHLGLGAHVYDSRLWDSHPLARPQPDLPEGLVEHFWQFSAGDDGDYERFAPRFRELDAGNVSVLLGATATHVDTEGMRCTGVEITGEGGKRACVRARIVVLAAGGIENARLMLASRRQWPQGVGNEHDQVGRYLMDHPRVTFATYGPEAAPHVTDRLGFVRAGGRNYQYGFALSPALQRREELLNCAAWLTERRSADDPWDAMKRLRSGRGDRVRDALAVAANGPRVAQGLYRRLVEKRGVPHKLDTLEFDIIAEQAPDPESRVLLSEAVDAFGVPRARLNWRVGDLEKRSILRLAELVMAAAPCLGLAPPAPAAWLEAGAFERSNLRDVAHPIGTTRMSADPRKGVVDADCAVHGVPGLYVAGSSTFATAGHANPTLMIVALAIRLADTLKNAN